MSDKLIIKETKPGEGSYIIEVDREIANRVKGNSYSEILRNAIDEFLELIESHRKCGNEHAEKK